MVIRSYAYLKIKMTGPHGVITIAVNFQDACKCVRLAVEQAQRDLILDDPRLDDEAKHDIGLGTPQHSLQFVEHQPMVATLASVLPLFP